MRQLTALICATTLLTISGCANWPEKGQGGMAEHHLAYQPTDSFGPEHGLYFEQDLSRRHLDTLVLAGADICFPASVKTAHEREDRISRALQGGLKVDAANDLIIQRDKLATLERRLDYVKQEGICLNTNYASIGSADTEGATNTAGRQAQVNTGDQIKYILSLLNNNNQFAFDSSQLNPRYIGHLAEAVVMLRTYPAYSLKLTGHADVKGDSINNQQLSLDRARQVARYLQIFGLNSNSIIVNASGSTNPLLPGSEPHIRLVNRRVSIELIDTSDTTELIQP
ncbi:MAG: outer membrane protein OmpA-like peptidoglycan-associated protein [Moritella sp.]|jgi:outer membrane protein OmpA-like peptidoglycan-associated protein